MTPRLLYELARMMRADAIEAHHARDRALFDYLVIAIDEVRTRADAIARARARAAWRDR